ncbi:MAG: Uma2 family endonuclease [candidate division KSB1 bacterium]|nr:Uma2 family endonuclease [candidate division KSB1 bacterium]
MRRRMLFSLSWPRQFNPISSSLLKSGWIDERVEGAPDIVVEVLSPDNWLLDRRDKFKVYAKAGVREYWIVDPHARTIELFGLRGSIYALIGKYAVGETVRSEVLAGFEVKVEEVCPA